MEMKAVWSGVNEKLSSSSTELRILLFPERLVKSFGLVYMY